VHAIEAHHYEIEPQTVEAVLLISGRRDLRVNDPARAVRGLEHYIKRLESLEELAAQKPGVEKVYALQAGREIRVIRQSPAQWTTTRRAPLDENRAEIEDQLEYPGQVKVTVIRESRAIDVAATSPRRGHHDSARAAGAAPRSSRIRRLVVRSVCEGGARRAQ